MELLRALGCLAEPPSDESREVAALLELGELRGEDWHELFVLQLVPYASVYLGSEGMLGGEARDRIAGFWRALGLSSPDEPDHLTVLLSAYSSLCDAPDAAVDSPSEDEPLSTAQHRRRHLARVFFWEHLMSWLPAYLQRARRLAQGGYRRWAELLQDALTAEARQVPQPPEPPAAQRSLAPVADPRAEGGKPFVASLLAPARSGLIMTRADLGRLARETDLGIRRGERAYMLKALLAQDGSATLRWLAEEASRQSTEHRSREAITGPFARQWAERAAATGGLLADLADEAARAAHPAGEPAPRPTAPEVPR